MQWHVLFDIVDGIVDQLINQVVHLARKLLDDIFLIFGEI